MSLIPDHEVRLKPVDESLRLARIEMALTLLQGATERMERKLDALLVALADDGQEDERGVDLEGNVLPAERDPNDPL
jgi:hypothetical protein